MCHLYNNKYLCFIDYLACGLKILSVLPVVTGGGFKQGNKIYDKIFGIGNPDLLINLMSCYGYLEKQSVVILKYPKRMLKYYISKGFTLF